MIGRSDRVRATRLYELVEDNVDLAREPGIRVQLVGDLLRHMTPAEVAEAVREHGDAPAVVAQIERLSPGVIEEAREVHITEAARA